MTHPRILAALDSEFGTTVYGVRIDRQRRTASVASVSFYDNPKRNAPELKPGVTQPLPPELLRLLMQVERDATTSACRESVSSKLTALVVDLCQQQFALSQEKDEVTAIGVHGCGVWNAQQLESRVYTSLLQPAVLAEASGITVVDDFPARDLAQGGIGGPVESHGLCMLLADRTAVPGRRWRGILDIADHATHFTSLPPVELLAAKEPLVSVDVTVGTQLWNELLRTANTPTLSGDIDKVATQGRVIHELIEIWQSHRNASQPWHPDGCSPLPLTYALENSPHTRSPLPDRLATATHFLAQEIATHVLHRTDSSRPIGELFLKGVGSRSGLLVRMLREQLPFIPIRRIEGASDQLHAAAIATLAMLHLWQIPLPPSQGAGIPRVLGRLTPGSPSSWQRVLRTMSTNAPWLLPLREAI